MVGFLELPEDLQRELFYRLHVFDRMKLARLVLPRGYADRVLYRRRDGLDASDAGVSEDAYIALMVCGLRKGCNVDRLDMTSKFMLSRMESCDPTLRELTALFNNREAKEWITSLGHEQEHFWRTKRLIDDTKREGYVPSEEDVHRMFSLFVGVFVGPGDTYARTNYTVLLQQMAYMSPSSFSTFARALQHLYDDANASDRYLIDWGTEDALYASIVSSPCLSEGGSSTRTARTHNVPLLRFLHYEEDDIPALFRLSRIRKRLVFEGHGLQRFVGDAEGIRVLYEFNTDVPLEVRKTLFELCFRSDCPKKGDETANSCIAAASFL